MHIAFILHPLPFPFLRYPSIIRPQNPLAYARPSVHRTAGVAEELRRNVADVVANVVDVDDAGDGAAADPPSPPRSARPSGDVVVGAEVGGCGDGVGPKVPAAALPLR